MYFKTFIFSCLNFYVTLFFSFGQEVQKNTIRIALRLDKDRIDSIYAHFEIAKFLSSQDQKTAKLLLVGLSDFEPLFPDFYAVRLELVKARYLLNQAYPNEKETVIEIMEKLLEKAYLSGDARLIGMVNWEYGDMLFLYGHLDLASTYFQIGMDNLEKFDLGAQLPPTYLSFAEMLFHIQEYEKCIFYIKKAIGSEGYQPTSRYLNTMGQAYLRLQRLDSAKFKFLESNRTAIEEKDELWEGINYSYLGLVEFESENYNQAEEYLINSKVLVGNLEPHISAQSNLYLSKLAIRKNKMAVADRYLDEALSQIQIQMNYPAFQQPDILASILMALIIISTNTSVYQTR